MADRRYNLRKPVVCDYRQLASLKLPRGGRKQVTRRLYPIEVVAWRDSEVRIHYIGYDEEFDEWRQADDLVPLNNNIHTTQVPIIQPYSLHFELGLKLKQNLVCGKKQAPRVTIDMGFDYLLFRGGLQVAGVAKETVRVIQRYTLVGYHDLDHLLGENWHYRGINSRGDYAFIILDTIEYYISKRRFITVYSPPEQPSDDSTPHKIDAGYSLKFSFVRGYGNRSTFGTDTSIFS